MNSDESKQSGTAPSDNAPAAIWRHLEDRALSAFLEIGASDSPGMVTALRRAVRFAAPDSENREIVISRNAFLFGVLSSGLLDTPSLRFGNTSSWMAAWLQQHVTSLFDRIQAQMSGTDTLLPAAASSSVVASQSMAAVGRVAVDYARRTVRRGRADLRHFVSAYLTDEVAALETFSELGWSATPDDIAKLGAELYSRIAEHPEDGEDLDAWSQILEFPSNVAGRDAEKTEVANFASDSPKAPFWTDDPLGLDPDVNAFARLICLSQVEPPLSIGLFGGWGSGKSTFMHRLERRIEDLTKETRADAGRSKNFGRTEGSTGSEADRGPETPNGPTFVQNVIQVRFNAWHFADANLWASLTAEFFDQFRAGGYSRAGKAVYERLMERVNAHVHTLTTEAEQTKIKLAASAKALQTARDERDAARLAADVTAAQPVAQTLVDSVISVYAENRQEIIRVGGKKALSDVAAFVTMARQLQTLSGYAAQTAKFATHGWHGVFTILGIVILIAATLLITKTDLIKFDISGFVAFAAGVGSFAGGLTPVLRVLNKVGKSTSAVAAEITDELEENLKQVAEKQEALKRASAEHQALRAAAERASAALARYVDPDSPSGSASANPPRLLRYMLEDDPETQALEKEIGLISRVRRLFQAVDEIVREQRGRDPEVPDRVIIYIDDLDRCTPSQVYAVLQAIHLLLAFELFVVVVGVDLGWVAQALARELRPGPREGEEWRPISEDEAQKLATRYMEKIFQLPFWLRPLSAQGSDGGSYARYVRAMLQANLESQTELDLSLPLRGPGEDLLGKGVNTLAVDLEEVATLTANDDTSGLDDALATVKLTQAEIDFLASPTIASLAGSEPRTVKRFINIYRIVRARLNSVEREAFLGNGKAPPAFPIAAALIALETGQTSSVAAGVAKAIATTDGELKFPEPELTAVGAAMAKVAELRGSSRLAGADCRPWSAVARRYSFHPYSSDEAA